MEEDWCTARDLLLKAPRPVFLAGPYCPSFFPQSFNFSHDHSCGRSVFRPFFFWKISGATSRRYCVCVGGSFSWAMLALALPGRRRSCLDYSWPATFSTCEYKYWRRWTAGAKVQGRRPHVPSKLGRSLCLHISFSLWRPTAGSVKTISGLGLQRDEYNLRVGD